MQQEIPPFFQEKFPWFNRFSFLDRRWLSASAAVFFGIVILIVYSQSGSSASSFMRAEKVFAEWESMPQDEALFRAMSQALEQVPELRDKYQAVIAQQLIAVGKGAQAFPLAYGVLETAREETPLHADYAETSLLIEQGECQRALERAVGLRERIAKECDVEKFCQDVLVGGAFLYAHNLLRIAFLQQELQNAPGETAAWHDLEAFLERGRSSPVSELILNSFREEGVDLAHYMADRKRQLQNSLPLEN